MFFIEYHRLSLIIWKFEKVVSLTDSVSDNLKSKDASASKKHGKFNVDQINLQNSLPPSQLDTKKLLWRNIHMTGPPKMQKRMILWRNRSWAEQVCMDWRIKSLRAFRIVVTKTCNIFFWIHVGQNYGIVVSCCPIIASWHLFCVDRWPRQGKVGERKTSNGWQINNAGHIIYASYCIVYKSILSGTTGVSTAAVPHWEGKSHPSPPAPNHHINY